jgi:endonuclease/exonuclease/phosphatase family metal-dependent hydrolase
MAPLTIASWNIHKAVGADGRRDPARILTVLEETGADVAILQEADTRFGLRTSVLPAALLEEAGWRPVPYDRRGRALGWHGNAVLLRGALRLAGFRRLALPALEPRGAVLADLDHAGAIVRVVGLHLDLSGLRRRDQVRRILARLAAAPGDPPTVVAGDMNVWAPAEPCLDLLAQTLRSVSLGPSFPARLPFAALDRIHVSQGVEILSSGVHQSSTARRASDHLPVVARIALPGAGA